MKKLMIAALILAAASWVMASDEDDPTSLSYISYLERYATIQPANQSDGIEALVNMPVVPGDRIDTAREARLELVLADGNTVWIDQYTTLSMDAVAFSRDGGADRTVVYLAEGIIVVEISEHRLASQPVRIDGLNATVYLNDRGLYRIEALPSGGLRLEVWEGLGEASTSSGGVLVRAETSAEVGHGQLTGTETNISWGDEFATWVEQRRNVRKGDSSLHVDARYDRQAAQLDNYGTWVYVDNLNTWAWQPTVSAGWRPYTAGRWYWTHTGWSWVSYEPWGWLPYHYGSWSFSIGFGWVWSWGRSWSPAWVNWCWWPGYVGWCPYGYYNSWYWPRYCHYYGYPSWPYYTSPHPGGGSAQPNRRDVMPPASGTRTKPATSTMPAPEHIASARSRPRTPALDLDGRVRVSAIDRSGWNVVSDRNFASPHLSRLVQRGEIALRDRGDQMGVVMSGPLATESPSRTRPSQELERVFRGVEQRSPQDMSPILARNDQLRPADAVSLVKPSSLAEVARRGDSGTRSTDPMLTTRATSPFSQSGRSASSKPLQTTNRPTSALVSRRGASTYRNPFVTRSRPSTLVSPVSSTSRSGAGTLSGSTRSPSSSRSNPARVPSTGSRGTTGSRPVIVPRTSTSRPPSGNVSRPSTSTRSPSSRSSGGRARAPSRSAPSSRPSARAPSSSRSSSPRASAPRSSGGGRSSAGSRSSGGSSSKSSGGGARKQ
jgi:hypothetical protein